MIRCVAYGTEEEVNFYVQSCCNEEHVGGNCDCRSFGENFTESAAKTLALQKANELNVPVEIW